MHGTRVLQHDGCDSYFIYYLFSVFQVTAEASPFDFEFFDEFSMVQLIMFCVVAIVEAYLIFESKYPLDLKPF